MERIGVKSKTIASRSNRHNNQAQDRRARRTDAFSMGRNLGVVDDEFLDMDTDLDLGLGLGTVGLVPEVPKPANAKAAVPNNGVQIGDRRRQQLVKWKEEKNQKKKAMKSSQKPIFITGIVHHSVGSPNLFKTTPSVLPNKPGASKKRPQFVKAKSPLKMYVAPQRGAQTRNMTKKNCATASCSNGNTAMKGVPCNTKFKAPKGLMSIAALTVPHTPKGMAQRKRVMDSVEEKRVVSVTSSARVVSPRKRAATETPNSHIASPPKRVVATASNASVGLALLRKKGVTATPNAKVVSPQKRVVIPKDKVVYPQKKVAFATPKDKVVSRQKKVITPTPKNKVVSPRKKVVIATPGVNVVPPQMKVVIATPKNKVVSPRKKVVIPTPKNNVASPRKKVVISTPKNIVVSPRKNVVIATPKDKVVSPRKKVVFTTPRVQVVSPRKKVVIATPSVNVVSPQKVVIPTPRVQVVSPRKKVVIATPSINFVSSQKVVTPTPRVQVVSPHGSGATNVTDEVEQGPVYYRNLLDTEIVRLTALCTKWDSVRPSLPEPASEDLLGRFDLVIGMTQLLMRSKLQQFRGLTEECERGDSEPPVLSSDLRGFWELVGIQISAVDKLFDELEELRAGGWVEKARVVARKVRKAAVAKPAGRPAVAGRSANGIRAMIAATRKKQLEEQSRLEERVEATEQLGDRRLAEIRATPAGSAKRHSLLQRALSASAAKRAGNSSPIVMRVSRRGKLGGEGDEGAVRGEKDIEGVVRGEGGEAAVRAEMAMEGVVDSGDSGDSSAAESQPELAPPSSLAGTALTGRHRKRGHLRQCVMNLARDKEARRSVMLPTATTNTGGESGKENAAVSWNSSLETQADVKKLAVLKVANDGNVPNPSVQSPAKSRTPAKGQRRSKVRTPANTQRVYQKTPHNAAAQLGDRVSLLPCQTETTPTCLTSAMEDLISFDTPVRRSTRLAKL